MQTPSTRIYGALFTSVSLAVIGVTVTALLAPVLPAVAAAAVTGVTLMTLVGRKFAPYMDTIVDNSREGYYDQAVSTNFSTSITALYLAAIGTFGIILTVATAAPAMLAVPALAFIMWMISPDYLEESPYEDDTE